MSSERLRGVLHLVRAAVGGEATDSSQLLGRDGVLDQMEHDTTGFERPEVVGVATPEQREVGLVTQAELELPPAIVRHCQVARRGPRRPSREHAQQLAGRCLQLEQAATILPFQRSAVVGALAVPLPLTRAPHGRQVVAEAPELLEPLALKPRTGRRIVECQLLILLDVGRPPGTC